MRTREGKGVLRVYLITDMKTGVTRRVEFAVATEAERVVVRCLRFKIYKEKGYFLSPPADYNSNPDYDSDGFDDRSPFFVARDEGGDIIASARLVRGVDGENLPIERSFYFEMPEELRDVPRVQIAEIGKLISQTPHWMRFGGLVATIGLVDAIRRYSRMHELSHGFSFIKQRLLGRLEERLEPSPFHEIVEAVAIYPRTGPLAGYFYADEKNRPTATWYRRTEVAEALKEAKVRLRMLGITEEEELSNGDGEEG